MRLQNSQPPPACIEALQRRRWTCVPDFLHEDSAHALESCLLHDVPWGLAYRLNSQPVTDLQAADTNSLAPDIRRQLLEQQGEPFQFVYNTYMMVTAYLERRHPELLLNRVLEWLNSPMMLAYFRRLTGVSGIAKLNAQATRYLPGHFLKNHNDYNSDEGRRFAYVLGLTRHWRPDWGGLLHFTDEHGQVRDTVVPAFNTLTIFCVPQDHFVSYVAPFAEHPRLAITGWLLDK